MLYARFRWAVAAGLVAAALALASSAAYNATFFALDLQGANLSGSVELRGGNLANADWRGADLTGVDLRGADLTGSRNLTAAQLRAALTDETTKLNPDLRAELAGGTPPPTPTPSPTPLPNFAAASAADPVQLTYRPYKVALSADGALLAAVGQTTDVSLWRLGGGAVEKSEPLTGATGFGRSVVFTPDGKALASGNDDGAIRLWRVGETAPFTTLRGDRQQGYVFSLEYSTDGRTLVSASRAVPSDVKTVRTWAADGGGLNSEVEVKASERIVDVSPDQQLMVIISPGIQGAQLRSTADNNLRGLLESSQQEITTGAFSSDGQVLAMSVRGRTVTAGTILLWRASDGRLLSGPLVGPRGDVLSLAFSPDASLLAAGWSDGSIHFWRVGDGEKLFELTGHARGVQHLAFSGDGGTLASAGVDSTIRLWRVTRQ